MPINGKGGGEVKSPLQKLKLKGGKMYNECKHKELKYFEQTDQVICLGCGRVFPTRETIKESYPVTPITIPQTTPYNPCNPGVWYSTTCGRVQ
jgi:hypothetical protein